MSSLKYISWVWEANHLSAVPLFCSFIGNCEPIIFRVGKGRSWTIKFSSWVVIRKSAIIIFSTLACPFITLIRAHLVATD